MSTLTRIPLTLTVEGTRFTEIAAADLVAVYGVSEATVLPAFKAALGVRVDAVAEDLRSKITTPGAGQAMEYLQVQTEAYTALNGSADKATADTYPMLAATIGIDVDPSTNAPATDVLGVARSVQQQFNAWLKVGAAIRRGRLAGKLAIDAATTLDAAAAACDAIVWPPLG